MKKGLDGSVTCNFCNGTIKCSGNTSNLRTHLHKHHPDVKLESSETLTVKNNLESDGCSTTKKIKLNSEDEGKENTVESESKQSKIFQTKQLKVDGIFDNQKSFKDGPKANGMLNRILFMIAKDQMPYSCVEKIGFRSLLNYAVPLYQIPSRKTITLKMEEKYQCMSNVVKEDLAKVKYITLTADAWSDTLNNVSYLGVTCHFIQEYELQSINVGITELNDHHTADNLKTWLLEITKNWKISIESIVAVVTDNAANIKKAVKDAFGEEKYLDCLAHTLNLVPSALLSSDDIKPILSKVKEVVKFFKHSNNAYDKLRALTKERLIQSVETRWNSDYEMINRFIELSEKVASVLLQMPKSPTMLTADDMQVIKELTVLLKPFYNATKIISGEKYLTGSQAIPIIKTLEKEIESKSITTTLGIQFQKKLTEQFKKRFENIEYKTQIAMATIFDPRFKKMYFKNKLACADAINRISKQLQHIYTTENSLQEDRTVESPEVPKNGDFWTYHDQLLSDSRAQQKEKYSRSEMPDEFRNYLNELPISKDSDPLVFWKMHRDSSLADLALRYLTIVATSVPSERLFSAAGMIMNQYRNRLTPEHFQELLFLNLLPSKYWKI